MNKIKQKSKNKDNVNCIKMLQGVETNPRTIDNKFNSYFTTIPQNIVSKIKQLLNFVNIQTHKYKIQYFLVQQQRKKKKDISTPSVVKNQVIYMEYVYYLFTTAYYCISKNFRIIYFRNFIHSIFSQRVFPNHMKLAIVTLVYKRGSKLDMTNYQPI